MAAAVTAADRPDTRELAGAARSGDERAFAELVHRYAAPLCRYLVMWGLSESDAEDVVQDTFIRAFRAIDRYDRRHAFSTWLYTIARRLAINHVTRRRPWAPLDAVAAPAGPDPGTRSVERAEPGALWRFARDRLNERYFEVLWLHYGEDLEVGEVARVLGITRLHARVLLHRARTRLRALIEHEAPALMDDLEDAP